jgi:integrase
MGKLTATQFKALSQPGRYSDGEGLILDIGKGGARSWVVRVQANGRRRDIGLGSAKDLGLADAREKAAAIRKQVRAGIDPVAEKKREKVVIPTFKQAAEQVHAELQKGWRNGKHGAQWLSTLEAHAFPMLGDKPVNEIDGPAIRDVLADIWLTIPETARRVRQRIGAVLDWSHSRGWRTTEAPMRSISKGLPRQPKKTGHFAAMPFADVPAFLSKVREETTWSRMAVEAVILTATRSGEVRGARWSELDIDGEHPTWTIPAARMKAHKVHVVPLSDSAVALFRRALELKRGDLVFPGRNPRLPQSDMTLTKLLRDMGHKVTVHGFRSAFRDWVAEETSFPGEIAEAALAHAVPNRVEAAYRRTDFLAKRRQLMAAWATYLEEASGNVVKITDARPRTSSPAA